MCGIAFVMAFYPSKVFPGGRTTFYARVLLGLSYAVVFASGLITLDAVVAAGAPSRLSIFAAMVITTLVNFLAARFMLRKG
jgi:hypothetical protein